MDAISFFSVVIPGLIYVNVKQLLTSDIVTGMDGWIFPSILRHGSCETTPLIPARRMAEFNLN